MKYKAPRLYRKSESNMWNGYELTGIGEVSNDHSTRTAWANLVLSIYKQAVNDCEGIKRLGMSKIDLLDHMSAYEADINEIEEFLHFESRISKFYKDMVDAYFAMFESYTSVEKLT